MRTGVAVLAVVLALVAADPAAQQRNAPSTESVRMARGQVRADDTTSVPLRRARVSVPGGEPVFTDAEGRFSIEIPSTATVLRITKPGFAPRHVSVGTPPLDGLEVGLVPGAAIVGDVVDELGSPAIGSDVRVRRVTERVDAEYVPIDTIVQTDDLGQFRVGSLPAGEYLVTIEGRDVRSSGPTTTRVRAKEEVGVALFHDSGATAVRAATSYAEGYEAGTKAALSDPALWSQSRGTATISGRITRPYGRAVAGAIVRLEPTTAGVPRVAASDIQGRFEITEVASGAYRLKATKVGFMPGEYGGGAAERGTVMTVRDGQQLRDLDIALPRGAVVTGIITDAAGEPIEGIAMHVWQVNVRNGRRFAEPVLDVSVRRTDDRGHYRLHGLQAGVHYVVAADHPAAGRAAAHVPDALRSYYPGVGTLTEAAPVKVDVGLDATGTDLAFRPARTTRVRGEARTSTGDPLNRPVTLAGSTRLDVIALPPQEATQTGAAFEFKHVVRGLYVLQGIHVVNGRSGLEALESTTLPVNVTTDDLELPPVSTSPGSTVIGRVVAEGMGLPPLVEPWLDVMPANLDDMAHRTPRPWTVHTNADGTFEITGLQGLMRFISTSALPPGWWLKSVEIDGRNAADVAVSFGANIVRNNVRVVLSTVGADISGRALDGRRQPVATYVAVAFSVDRGRWYPGSRHVRLARPEVDMQFRLGPLPPGDYWVAAVDTFDDRSIQDPDVLRRLTAIARRVTLSTGQGMVVDLSLGRLGR
jgi:hypothetical protein